MNPYITTHSFNRYL